MSDSLGFQGWNIFALELAEILGKRGLRLGHLNDRAGIHPQKVSRLQHSLREPKFNVLSPDDLDHIERVFNLTTEEVARLRAAILATAIEEMLMNRINSQDAFLAARQVFPTLVQMVSQSASEEWGIGAVKGLPLPDSIPAPAEPKPDVLEQVELGLLYCQLAARVNLTRKRDYATMAGAILREALTAGDALDEVIKAAIDWTVWRAECVKALAVIDKYRV